MSDVKRNTSVGVFVLIGFAALAWLMSSFGELPAILGRGEYELRIVVKEPSGIGEGSAIYLGGVQIGRIRELKFKDPEHLDAGVVVIGAIRNEYKIPRTAWAVVQPAGLGLGRGKVDIKVQEGELAQTLLAGEEIPGVTGNPWGPMIPDTLLNSIDKSVAQFGNFVEALTPVASDLHDLLEKHTIENVDNPAEQAQRLTANISTVVERFDQTLKAFNETFGDERFKTGWIELFDNVKQMSVDGRSALENIKNITANLQVDIKRISDKLETGIDGANRHIDEIAGMLRPVLEHASQLAGSLARLSLAMEHGEGTAGRFMTDPKLYESMLLSTQRLTELIDTLNRMFTKFERDGAIGVNAKTPIGPVHKDFEIPK